MLVSATFRVCTNPPKFRFITVYFMAQAHSMAYHVQDRNVPHIFTSVSHKNEVYIISLFLSLGIAMSLPPLLAFITSDNKTPQVLKNSVGKSKHVPLQ